MNDKTIEQLRDRLGNVIDINAAMALLQWDQEVYMPKKAAPMRGKQLSTLASLAHRMHTSPEVGDAIRELQDAGLEGDAAIWLSEVAYDYARATKLPEAFVQRFAEEQSKAYEAWVPARRESNFKAFAPHLQSIVELLREKAEHYGYAASPYDALIEDYERGMTTVRLKAIFGELAPRQSALVQRIAESPRQPDVTWLNREWKEDAQWAFTLRVLKDMGYDFDAGRQDKSVHPFTTNFDLYDVRVTTRIRADELFSGLTGSMHEGGHALYEQGFRQEDQRTTLAAAPSLGIHESQSRLWENLIGRSLPFWKHYTPILRKYHRGKLTGVAPEQVYAAINRVAPTFIRVEADECTYNLHVILRFELELDLIEGRLNVADVPEAWNAKVKQYLGLDVPDDAHGCLQDIHWSHGSMGYFPTYALGNLYAAQLMEQIERDVPALWRDTANGEFANLLAWLRQQVHQYGRRKQAPDIVKSATGRPPDSAAFLRYLERKYGALYKLA